MFNATKHGLTGQQIVIRGEDPAQYDAVRASLLDEHQPGSEEEAMLVERIAINWWKLLRAERFESELIESIASADVFSDRRFLAFMRYRNTIERAWNRARRELAALQKARAAASDPPESVLSKEHTPPIPAPDYCKMPPLHPPSEAPTLPCSG